MILPIDNTISLLQAVQLVALAPCLFVILFLLAARHDRWRVVVPCLYFAALAAGFFLPLVALWPQMERHPLHLALVLAQSLLPALSFLLIIQFATGRVPSLWYWGILALPLLGGGGIVYAALLTDELCLSGRLCASAADVEGVFATVSNGVIFLLLVVVFARTRRAPPPRDTGSRNEYWLMVALIGLNLFSLAIGLWRVHGGIGEADALFIHTMLRLTFIYVVLTLLFRVFDHGRAAEQEATGETSFRQSPAQAQRDMELLAAFDRLMEEEQVYREMECSRERVARMLGISGNMLSRIVNQHRQARFTDVINQYRIKDAQRLLLADAGRPVTDIAFEVGFNSIPSFNRVFKDRTGFSPTAFRATRLSGRSR